jgi:dipeptidyl aminopeptidase/acylaminoacyl peptidase
LGPARRLVWRDAGGIAAYGDLVLPPRHRPGERHPLIVVQYQSRGFLRGGSGNEFPIYPLAAHGFAVLSINQPRREIGAKGADARDAAAFQARMYDGLWQRRALLAALDAGIDAAIATGTVDPAYIGLTGMSDGAVTAVFALVQHPRYKAAAIGPGWLDPVSYTAEVGPRFSDMVARWGLPPADPPADFWREVSVARNADRIRLPILVQTCDA